MASTGWVPVNQVLLRGVTTFVTSYRISGFAGDALVLGPVDFPKQASVRIDHVPLAVNRIVIEYLSATGAVIGRYETPVSISAGATSFIEDPNWTSSTPPAPTATVAGPTMPVGGRPLALVQGDFNRDGVIDLASVNNQSQDMSVLLGNGSGSFGPAGTYASRLPGLRHRHGRRHRRRRAGYRHRQLRWRSRPGRPDVLPRPGRRHV